MKLTAMAVVVLALIVMASGIIALHPAAAQYTSLRAVKFDVADFTFSSSTYVQGVLVEFNTSATTTDLILLSSMNIKKLSALGTATEVWTRITVDGTEVVLEERLRTVQGTDEGSTGTRPVEFSVGPGQHNISMEFYRAPSATIEINDIDITLSQLVTTAGGIVRGQLINGSYTHSSTSFTPALDWTVNKAVASPTFIASKQTARGTTAARIDYYFENLNYSRTSPYWSRHLSSADDVGSMSGIYIDSETNGTQNYTIQAKTDAGTITVNYTLLDFDLRVNTTRPINNFSVSNNLTNVTMTHSYSAGTHLIANKTVALQNGTGVFLAMTSSFGSTSGAQTPTYFINATGVPDANCSSKKERYLSGNDDIGNAFIYTICDNLTTGNTYTFNLWLQVPTGETVKQFDESFSGFEITPFDITQTDITTDLSINKSEDRDPVLAGTALTYTLNVTNNGPNDAATVNVTDTLPENVSFHSASPSPTGSSGQLYWWVFSTISVGNHELIAINVTVNSSTANGTIVKNTANVTSATPDSLSGNNGASENTSVLSNACLGDCYNATADGTNCTGTIIATNVSCYECLNQIGGLSWHPNASCCPGRDLCCPDWCFNSCPACGDGIDNDNDNKTDCPEDDGCACCCDYTETSEEPTPCVSELSTLILFSAGLLVLVGYIAGLKKKRE